MRTLGADACADCTGCVFITLSGLDLVMGPTNPGLLLQGGLDNTV